MLQTFTISPHSQDALVTNFLLDNPSNSLPNLSFTPYSKPPDHPPRRFLAIGHPDDVDSVVN